MSAALWVSPGPLRDLVTADGPAIAAALRDPAIRRWLPVPRDAPADAFASWAAEASALRASGDGLRLAADVDGALATCFEVKRVDRRARTCEVSYWSASAARGAGTTTRSLRALADWLLDDVGLRRVELRIAPGNDASLAVASRSGFVREGLLRRAGFTGDGTPTDLVVWSRTDLDLPSAT